MLASNSFRLGAIVLGLTVLAPAWLVPSPHGYGQDAGSKAKDGKGKWVPVFEHHAGEYVIRVGKPSDSPRDFN